MSWGQQNMNPFHEKMEALGGDALLVDPSDAESVSALERDVREICAWAKAATEKALSTGRLAEDILGRLRRNELSDPRAGTNAVAEAVGTMYDLLVAGKKAETVAVPAALKALAAASKPAENDEFFFFGATTRHPPLAQHPPGVLEPEEILDPVDVALLPTFVSEAREHLDDSDVVLMALESNPDDPERINALFRSLHTIKGSAGAVGLLELSELAHQAEQVLDGVRRGWVRLEGVVIDTIFDSIEALRQLLQLSVEYSVGGFAPPRSPSNAELIARLATVLAATSTKGGSSMLGDILVGMHAASPEGVERALEVQKANPGAGRLGEIMVQQHEAPAKAVVTALRIQKGANERSEDSPPAQVLAIRDVVKVDAERLDRLIDTIGELVIAESMVSHSPDLLQCEVFPKIQRQVGQMDKISRSLQEMATSLRLVPLRETFQKMQRVVRDLSRKLGKQVDFVMVGEATELDKSFVDRLGDPLTHMIRNSLDHGLERPDERLRAGKSATGRIEIRARHAGDEIIIEIEDDGRGLNRDAIYAKAVERGIIQPGAVVADADVWAMIFEPGFSTAQQVTDVSGRGVGTDVVKKTIEDLRGSVEVYSEPGKKAIFTIRLPLTLAVIDGMLVSIAGQRYILPTLSVVKTIHKPKDEIASLLSSGNVVQLGEEWIPVFPLRHVLGLCPGIVVPGLVESDRKLIVIVEHGRDRVGFIVDELLGQQQIVIKSLGPALDVPGVAGGAILPDGTVGLVLELGGVIRLAHS